MVELVDTQRSGRCARKGVRVRFPFSALRFRCSGANFDFSGPILVQYLLREDAETGPETRVNRVDQGLGAGVGHVGVEAEGRVGFTRETPCVDVAGA